MLITHQINMDLTHPGTMTRLAAVQGDSGTRQIALSLFSDGKPWSVPEHATASVRYRKPDGTGGFYDTMPDGQTAWSAAGNMLTVTLAPQMLTIPGCVIAQAELTEGTQILATFSFQIIVEENPSAGTPTSEDYVNWLGWMEKQLTLRLEEAKEDGSFTGATPQLQIGTVTTLPAGSNASAVIRGSAEHPLLDLNLPQGGQPPLDHTLTLSNAAAQAKAVGERLAEKAPLSLISASHLAESDAELESVIAENMSAASERSIRYFTVDTTENVSIGSGTWLMALCRDDTTTSALTAHPLKGNLSAPVRRAEKDGVWGQWEFDSPLHQPGSPVRTSRRYKGLPVFQAVATINSLPDTASAHTQLFPHYGVSCEICDMRLIIHDNDNKYWVNPSVVNSIALNSFCFDNGYSWYLMIETGGNLSGYTGVCVVDYVKIT